MLLSQRQLRYMKLSASVAEQFYIFDGYNIIHANEQLKNLLSENLEETRHSLIESILNFMGQEKAARGFLVFDGPNLITAQETFSSQLEIYFGKTADLIINKLSHELPLDSIINLVSSDRAVYNSILGKDRLIRQIKSSKFWELVKAVPRKYSSQKYNKTSVQDALAENIREKLDQLRQSE